MATSPDGSQPYWAHGYGQGRPQGQGEDAPANPYDFPSGPGGGQPYQEPGQYPGPYDQQPYEQQPYQQPPAPRIEPVQPPQQRNPATSGQGASNPLVRPYAMTGGRTRPRYQLAIEALVHTTADAARMQGQLPEHQRICHLCHEIKSVAEISALLSIPLGVARIL
ncbi:MULTISPECIES: DUF742 domain-containing protein, partial [unclassified Streptomyces]